MLLDIKGVSSTSLKGSAKLCYGILVFWTAGIIAATLVLNNMNTKALIEIFVINVFLDWHAIVPWTMWIICLGWGAIAVYLPVRPRAPKRAALMFWIVLIGCHIVTHGIWITVFCMRCHNFFINSLAGNIAKDTIEMFMSNTAKKGWVQDFLFVATPVANWVSAPYVFRFLQSLPPLDVVFWTGWNYVIVGFAFGVVPILCFAACIPIIMGYISAVDMGGNGSECVIPSKLELFYSLDARDRMDIRNGIKTITDFEYLDSTDNSGTGSSGASSENEKVAHSKSSSLRSYSESDDIKRIPSYKPNRGKLRV